MDLYAKIHELKINQEFYDRIASGQKRFEIRKDDRDFQVNDWLYLICGDKKIACKIIYKSTYEQKEGFCVLGFTVGVEAKP